MKKIFLLLLSIFLLTACGTDLEQKVDDNKSNNDSNEVQEEEISLASDKFYQIYQKLLNYTYSRSNPNGYKDFEAQEMLSAVLKDIKEEDLSVLKKKNEYQNTYGLKKAKVLECLKNVFGENIEFNPNSLVGTSYASGLNPNGEGSGMSIDDYDEKTETYSLTFGGIGGLSAPEPSIEERKIISAISKNDELIVTEKAIYVESDWDSPDESNITIYDSPAKNKVLLKESYNYDKAQNTNISVEDFTDYYTIVHIFKKNTNGTYYFAGNNIE